MPLQLLAEPITVWAHVDGPHDVPEMGVYAQDSGLFTIMECLRLVHKGFTVIVS